MSRQQAAAAIAIDKRNKFVIVSFQLKMSYSSDNLIFFFMEEYDTVEQNRPEQGKINKKKE